MDERSVMIGAMGSSGAPLPLELACTGAARGLHVSGIQGWYGTPDGKWSLTERKTGDGCFQFAPGQVGYASRTVTLSAFALGRDRRDALALVDSLRRMAHERVWLEVTDGGSTTAAYDGALTVEAGEAWFPRTVPVTATVVFPDPRRYGVPGHTGTMSVGSASSQGLRYDANQCIVLPLNYGEVAGSPATCSLANAGTATAWPVVTLCGYLAPGAVVSCSDGSQLEYSQPVWSVSPVVIDTLSGTAACEGVDVTRLLARRGMPSVPPGGSMSFSLAATGTGHAEVEFADTYV